MNTIKITDKQIYIFPEITKIELDNEISLALASNPPFGPGETTQSNQKNPFKVSLGLV